MRLLSRSLNHALWGADASISRPLVSDDARQHAGTGGALALGGVLALLLALTARCGARRRPLAG